MNRANEQTGSVAAARYHGAAISLHWLMALLIITGFSVGLLMVDMRLSPTKLKLFSYHKWIGVTVFMLLWLRLAWRLWQPPPAPLPGPLWQRRAASIAHGALYLLMIVIPLSGWLYSSAAGFQTVYLGLVPLPDLIAKDAQLKALLHEVHEFLNWTLATLVVLHAAAAVKHHLIDRDRTLARMLPWSGSRRRTAGEAKQ